MIKKLKNKKGFTLTELIVVIVIIGILAAVLIPSLTGYITKANKSVDEQKVASLNTLLIEAQVNEKEFKDALELKEYLEDEMDYDGDYSLKVKGSYMWYDTLKRKIVIIDDDEKMKISTTTVVVKPLSNEDTLEFVTDGKELKSPEGLMKYKNSKKEVWLIGGNGYLFDLVEEIRNIGNSGAGGLTKYNDCPDDAIKTIFKEFFNTVVFSGIKGTFYVEDGIVKEVTEENKENFKERDAITAIQYSNLAERFHKNVIYKKIDYITDGLNGLCKFDIKEEYNESVKVTIEAENGYLDAIGSVQKILEIVKDYGCELGYIIPADFGTVEEYKTHLENIVNCYINTSTEYKISNELSNSIEFLNDYNSNNDLTKYYQIKITEILGENSALTLEKVWEIYDLLNVALNLQLNDKNYGVRVEINRNVKDYNFFLNKNKIKLIGQINDPDGYGVFDIEYTFEFDVNPTLIQTNSQE